MHCSVYDVELLMQHSTFHTPLLLLAGCPSLLHIVELDLALRPDSQHAWCSWDNSCCEDGKWQQSSGAADLQHCQQQPFYHLLVDSKDWEGSWAQPPIAYVAQELLSAPEVCYHFYCSQINNACPPCRCSSMA